MVEFCFARTDTSSDVKFTRIDKAKGRECVCVNVMLFVYFLIMKDNDEDAFGEKLDSPPSYSPISLAVCLDHLFITLLLHILHRMTTTKPIHCKRSKYNKLYYSLVF